MSHKHIRVISDPAIISKLENTVGSIIESHLHFRLEWIEFNNWAVVPVEKGPHFNEREAEWFVEAANLLDCKECFAIMTEPGHSDIPSCYQVPVSQEAVLEFGFAAATLNFIVISEDYSFAILSTSEDYKLVAGPKAFVQKAVGSSIPTARSMFLNYYADDPMSPPKVREFLISVAKRYEPYNGE